MTVSSTLTAAGKKYEKFLRELKSKDTYVTVGVHEDTGAEVDGKTVVEIAAIHEFGGKTITTKDGRSVQQPPRRSWLNDTIHLKSGQIGRRMEVVILDAAKGKVSLNQGLNRLGLSVVADIQARIASRIAPENAQSTIDRKGSSTPLIDTGTFRSSITHKVKVGG